MVLSFGEVLMDCLPDKNVIGGAPFNVAIHLKRLGEEAGIISKIGLDDVGNQIQTFLEKEGIDTYVQKDDRYATGYVTVKFIDGQPDYTIHSGCSWEFLDFESVKAPDYLMFGSLALHFPKNKSSFLAYKEAFKSSTFICDLNLRKPYYTNETIELCLSTANILKINDEELDYLAAEYNIQDPIQWLEEKYKIKKVILTKGSKGATVYWEGQIVDCPITPVANLVDTVGAGDSFTALFIHGLIHGMGLKENLKRATEFAAEICQRSGAVPQNVELYASYKL